MAARQLVHRLGLRRYGYQGRSRPDRVGILDAAELLRRPATRSIRRLRALATPIPGRVSDRVQPAGLVHGTPLLLLRTLLGLEPIGEHLMTDPAVPADLGYVALLDIPGRWGRFDAFGRGRHRR